MLAQPVLEVHNLTKLYGSFRAVDSVSFRLPKGTIVGLLGPNGAGKTTTIQMLVGITLPDGGTIRYFGQDLHRTPRRPVCSASISRPRTTTSRPHHGLGKPDRLCRGCTGSPDPKHKIRELGAYFGITELWASAS